MDFNSLSLTHVLSLSRDILDVYKSQNIPSPTVRIIQAQIRELSALVGTLKQTLGNDFPADLLAIITDINGDLERYKKRVDPNRQRKGFSRWLAYVPVLKPLITSMLPAGTLYLAMASSYGLPLLIIFFVLFFGILKQFPVAFAEFEDAWHATEARRLESMKERLENHLARIKRFQTMHLHMMESNRFDVSKVLSGEARDFWVTNFGAENHSVDAHKFIGTLLYCERRHGLPEYKDDDKKLVFLTLCEVMDANRDGFISPQEFSSFLAFFGPVDKCCMKAINSLLNFTVRPPVMYPWVSWRAMDKKTAQECLSKCAVGTFTIRCSSRPGEFTVDYSTATQGFKIHHSRIKQNMVQGYHFEGSDVYFPDLATLVAENSSILVHPYVDPKQIVIFNVGGEVFQCHIGLFLAHPKTRLGKLVAKQRMVENQTLFFDRDPESFRVILNWYRYGKVVIPAKVPVSMVSHDLKFFSIPVTLPPRGVANNTTYQHPQPARLASALDSESSSDDNDSFRYLHADDLPASSPPPSSTLATSRSGSPFFPHQLSSGGAMSNSSSSNSSSRSRNIRSRSGSNRNVQNAQDKEDARHDNPNLEDEESREMEKEKEDLLYGVFDLSDSSTSVSTLTIPTKRSTASTSPRSSSTSALLDVDQTNNNINAEMNKVITAAAAASTATKTTTIATIAAASTSTAATATATAMAVNRMILVQNNLIASSKTADFAKNFLGGGGDEKEDETKPKPYPPHPWALQRASRRRT